MRIRTIKPEFWTDKRVASWDHFTRLLFIGLWSAADDHGRGSAEAARLASELFPYDLSRDPRETLARVAAGLETLAASLRITLYDVEGEAFYEVATWTKHQRVDNAGKPRVPTPSEGVARPSRDPREIRRESPLEQGTGNREQGNKGAESASPWAVALGLEMPESLRTDPCLEAVKLWLKHKSEKREGYKPTGLTMALKKWANEFTPITFPAAVEASIANGWSGIFPAKANNQAADKPKPMWLQMKELEARIETHPGNWNWLKYNSKTATKEQKDEYRALLKQLEAMQAGQEPLPMGEGDIP